MASAKATSRSGRLQRIGNFAPQDGPNAFYLDLPAKIPYAVRGDDVTEQARIPGNLLSVKLACPARL